MVSFFTIFLFNTISIAQAICLDCNDNNYETGDIFCACDEWEECKDIYHKSTAYEFDTGTSGTDYCLDVNTVMEAYINCWSWPWNDEILWEAIDCPSGYSCLNGECVYSGCDYDPECSYSYYRTCYSTTSYYRYTGSTFCDGGCNWTYSGNFGCGSGTYCYGWTYDSIPCYSCSNVCDNQCQASTCYGTDPDCDYYGNPTLACCGNGICEFGESFSNCPNDCKLGEGQGDCDSNNDCQNNLYCDCIGYCSGLFDWDTDYCCPYGSYWNGTACHTPKPDIRVEPSSLVFNI